MKSFWPSNLGFSFGFFFSENFGLTNHLKIIGIQNDLQKEIKIEQQQKKKIVKRSHKERFCNMEHSGEKRICENGGKNFNCNCNRKVTANLNKKKKNTTV